MCDEEHPIEAAGGGEDLDNPGNHTLVHAIGGTPAQVGEIIAPSAIAPPNPRLEQIREQERKLEEEEQHLKRQRVVLEWELRRRGNGGPA